MEKAEGRRQKAEGRRQKAEGRRQKAEGRRQKAEGRRQIVGLDFVKGVTIFLVVFGHCIQYGNGQEYLSSGAFFDDILFKIIYSFHMPLFALVSGYLFYWSVSTRSPREVIIRQANNLVLPSFSWALLAQTAISAIQLYTGTFDGMSTVLVNIWNRARDLWFLWAMFYASLVVVIVRTKLKDSVKAYAVITFLLLIVPGKIYPNNYVFVFPYFAAGYLWHRENMDEKFTFNKFMCAGVIILWLVMLFFYDRDSYVYTTGTSLIKYRKGIFVPSQLWTDLFRWLIGFAGCGSVLILLKLIKPVKFISAIGTKSLGIYIMSGYIIRRLPEHGGYIINFIEAVVITCACYVLSEAISRVKILNKILFGGR